MLLTSNGLTNPTITDAALELLGKPFEQARVAVVIDAFLPFQGHMGFLDRLRRLAEPGWGTFDIVSILGAPTHVARERLLTADAVLGYGGTNHWLAHAWRSTGLTDVLEQIVADKVYLGISAGSMIFSRAHAAAVEAFDDQEEVAMLDVQPEAALPLFDWFVSPHLDVPELPWHMEEPVRAGAARLGAPVWAIDDNTALRITDSDAEPDVVSEGRWLHLV